MDLRRVVNSRELRSASRLDLLGSTDAPSAHAHSKAVHTSLRQRHAQSEGACRSKSFNAKAAPFFTHLEEHPRCNTHLEEPLGLLQHSPRGAAWSVATLTSRSRLVCCNTHLEEPLVLLQHSPRGAA